MDKANGIVCENQLHLNATGNKEKSALLGIFDIPS